MISVESLAAFIVLAALFTLGALLLRDATAPVTDRAPGDDGSDPGEGGRRGP